MDSGIKDWPGATMEGVTAMICTQSQFSDATSRQVCEYCCAIPPFLSSNVFANCFRQAEKNAVGGLREKQTPKRQLVTLALPKGALKIIFCISAPITAVMAITAAAYQRLMSFFGDKQETLGCSL